eukprot:2463581-Heterocapsa_arctica.AAC.1
MWSDSGSGNWSKLACTVKPAQEYDLNSQPPPDSPGMRRSTPSWPPPSPGSPSPCSPASSSSSSSSWRPSACQRSLAAWRERRGVGRAAAG